MRSTGILLTLVVIGCGGETNATVDANVCGLGSACSTNTDCVCDNVCSAKSCVPPAACDEALLSFTTPTQNTDGTCLTDLGGFKLYWGLTEDLADATMVDMGLPCVDDVMVACGSAGEMVMQQVCSYRLAGLPNGTVYLAVSTYNTTNVESARSGVVSKMVACP